MEFKATMPQPSVSRAELRRSYANDLQIAPENGSEQPGSNLLKERTRLFAIVRKESKDILEAFRG